MLNSESISNFQIWSKSVICQKVPGFKQLKTQLLVNSKKKNVYPLHWIDLNVKYKRVQ